MEEAFPKQLNDAQPGRAAPVIVERCARLMRSERIPLK
jgi:hypothetical protein